MKTADILLFAEDPGAAKFLSPLPAALRALGASVEVLAIGLAAKYFSAEGLRFADPQGHSAESLLSAAQPKLVLVGTAENKATLGLELISAARRRGVRSAAVIDAAMNAQLRFCGQSVDPLAYAPDYLFVADDSTAETYAQLGFEPVKIFALGHPQYDRLAQLGAEMALAGKAKLRAKLFPKAPPQSSVIVFASEGSPRIAPETRKKGRDYTLTGRGTSQDRTEIVMEEFLDAVKAIAPAQPYRVLRIHPKDQPSDYAHYLSEWELISSGGDPLELVYAADLVVGSTSMLMTESALLGVPTLSIVPRESEKKWLPTNRSGLSTCVCRRVDLEKELRRMLATPPAHREQAVLPQESLPRLTQKILSLI